SLRVVLRPLGLVAPNLSTADLCREAPGLALSALATTRAAMLHALMGGQALTAKELAYWAKVSPSTASDHLSKLVAAKLLTVTCSRRFSYYRIASPSVAAMPE